MRITNISGKHEGVLRAWLPHSLRADHVVFLPDACPGKSPLPTGSVVLTNQPDWRRFAVSDCGCGMRLMRSKLKQADLSQTLWDRIALAIKGNKGKLGDLGGGNHFLDALLPYDEDCLYFLVHTGSREESGLVDGLVDSPDAFDREFTRVVKWAAENRLAVQKTMEPYTGRLELVLDLPHNTFEVTEVGVIIRKGAVRVPPGEMTVLPSHMSGDVVLLKAKSAVQVILNSLSHGTGRSMSRGEAKSHASSFDFASLRQSVMMPSFLDNASLTTEAPYAYRSLNDCLNLMGDYAEEIKRFAVIAYAGHL